MEGRTSPVLPFDWLAGDTRARTPIKKGHQFQSPQRLSRMVSLTSVVLFLSIWCRIAAFDKVWCGFVMMPAVLSFLGFVDRKSRFFTNIFFQIDLFCERCIPVFLQILVDDPLCVQRPGHLRLMNLKYKARFSLSFGRKCNIILQTIVTVFYLLIQPIKVVIHV